MQVEKMYVMIGAMVVHFTSRKTTLTHQEPENPMDICQQALMQNWK